MPLRYPPPLIAPGWRYDLVATPLALAEVICAAVGEIGVVEDPPGSNAGPVLRYGGELGEPWCADFLTWCYARADGGCPWARASSAWKLETWARAHHRVLPDSAPLVPGDVALLVRADFHGHAGLVVADLGGDYIATIEGNVHGAVRALVHPRSTFPVYLRPLAA